MAQFGIVTMREEEISPNFERRQLILKRGRTLVSWNVAIEGPEKAVLTEMQKKGGP
jgi:hypothetical protein